MTLESEAPSAGAHGGDGANDSSQTIKAPQYTKSTGPKSTAGLPSGETLRPAGDLFAWVVRDLGRRIGAEMGL